MSWNIDNAHSEINFSVRHMMISTVRGRFEKFEGEVNFDQDNLANSTVDVRIDAASIDTREAQRDAHLKSPDFLDAENHPEITFKSKRVEIKDKNHGVLIGDLTIRGVSREVALNVEFNGLSKSPWGTTAAGFSADTTINRKDWNLTWNVALETGGLLVGEEMKINIEVELVKQAEAVPA